MDWILRCDPDEPDQSVSRMKKKTQSGSKKPINPRLATDEPSDDNRIDRMKFFFLEGAKIERISYKFQTCM